jgi:tRNA U34 5-methylaminomethyl-2-thiouridine-forming methyltransferase MnmC
MLEFITTADGSKTIYNNLVGENYHSKHGALQESRHVFLNSGLGYSLEKSPSVEVSILEVGFGTGLNFLLSADYCIANNIKLNYIGIEAYPLTSEMIGLTGCLKALISLCRKHRAHPENVKCFARSNFKI